jgi:hypothetical protein
MRVATVEMRCKKREAETEKPREKHMKLASLCILKIFAGVGAIFLTIAGVDEDGWLPHP